MKLESVRALKAEMADRAGPPDGGLMTFTRAGPDITALPSGGSAGIALGIARGARPDDYRLAVRLQQRSAERSLDRLLPAGARGEVDVRFIGAVAKRTAPWHQSRCRPLLPGCSVAHHAVTAGTLGAFVRRDGAGDLLMLGNNHVLANEDRAAMGDAVVQPGRLDGGRYPGDVVGTLAASARLRTTGNRVDAALATVTVPAEPSLLTGLGTLHGLRAGPIEPGDRVCKIGRTTGLTRGIVTAIELDDVIVGFDRGALSFDGQIEIEGADAHVFSAGGDSGSLILDDRLDGCGLLFAGSRSGGSNGKGLTYANDLATVLQRLNAALVV